MSNETETLTARELIAAYRAGRRDFRRVTVRPNEGDPRANLAGADLADANLAGADLADANLAGADLARADLAGANLAGADLADAYLAGANLAGADLADAYLAGAYLAGAYGISADLKALAADGEPGAPPEPWRRRTPEELAERHRQRMERYRQRHPDVPMVENLDRRILDAVEQEPRCFNMSNWHSEFYENGAACGTSHCRAGWAITLAGEAGKRLELEHGSHVAGRMIYLASTGRVPHFFASNEAALEDMRRCAGAPATESTP